MGRKMIAICLCCLIFSGCTNSAQNQQKQRIEVQQNVVDMAEGRIGDDIPVTRATAAKMISLAFYSEEELKELSRETKFSDVSETAWGTPYIYGAVELGFMQGDEEGFHPEEPVTLYQAQVLMETLNPDSKTKIKLTEETKNKPVAYSLWMEVFIDALKGRRGEDSLYSYGILAKEMVLLQKTKENQWMTTQGILTADGYDIDPYIGKKMSVLKKENQIIGLIELVENNALIENVGYQWQGDSIEVDAGYGKVLYTYQGEKPKITQGVGDIRLERAIGKEIFPMEIIEKDSIIRADTNEIYLTQQGAMQWADNYKIYEEKKTGFLPRGYSRLISGTEIADFYLKDGKIGAAVIRRFAPIQNMRVLLSNTGFQGYYHPQVVISSNEDFVVRDGQTKKTIAKGQKLTTTSQEDAGLFQQQRILLEPKKNGIFTLESVSKGGAAPRYQGNLEIEKKAEGFLIVNALPFEDYIKGVVPGEMPISFGLEALKVQAVAARSYGYNQYYANAFGHYGAHVDDTTAYQVYNGYAEEPMAAQAVDETKGICLIYGNKIVNANFFSTSSGVTANAGEVWAADGGKTFPSENRAYLVSNLQGIEKDLGDLSLEENAIAFFKDWKAEGFDANSPWYRWQVTIPMEELDKTIPNGLKEVQKTNTNLVQVLQGDGSWKNMGFQELGKIQKVSVVERGTGGNAMVIEIIGEKQTVRVKTELAIRKVLRPTKTGEGTDIMMRCYDGSIRTNMNLLPSGFFVIEETKKEGDVLQEITLFGGGNGHGVGMSQYGAKRMAEQGYSFDKILEHYFRGATVQKATKD